MFIDRNKMMLTFSKFLNRLGMKLENYENNRVAQKSRKFVAGEASNS